jgi:phenylacetate-CoA ligase
MHNPSTKLTDVKELQGLLKNKPEKHWNKLGEKMALKLFKDMSQNVPAYKDFLKKNNFKASSVKTIDDFSEIPTIDKDNYLRKYSTKDLSWNGSFPKGKWVVSTTSGSTGDPYYFPRQEQQDRQYAVTAELYLRENFQIQKRRTLYVVGFPMGAWIGGVFTYEALKMVAERGRYDLTVITPGIHKQEIINAVKKLGKNYDQVIIGSYAPFLKDILDDGIRQGLNWTEYNLGFVFSAEAFSEMFRDYVAKKTDLKNIYTDTLNHYGTVDLGTMSHETPLSIMLRRDSMDNLDLYNAIFKRNDKVPTFTQYNPAQFYFEEVENSLYCSAYSGLPLVRYDLKDSGEVLGFEDLKNKLEEIDYPFDKRIKKSKIAKHTWNLPFVSVYERNDFSVSYYAFQIYPDMIRRPLQRIEFEELVTGKFTTLVKFDKSGQQKLEINIELKANQEETEEIVKHMSSAIVESLLTESSEYRETHKVYGDKVHPDIVFWPYEYEEYFKPGIKQIWIKK